MSVVEQSEIPEDLRLQLTGFVTPDQPFLRRELLDELVSTIPKDPEVRLLVYQGEVSSGIDIPWHIHNGPLLVVVIQGESILQFGDEVYHYKAGDVFIEPVGAVHRAYNPNPDVPTAALAVQITPPGRDHIVPVGSPPTDEMPMSAPRGATQPKPKLADRLEGS